MFSIWNDKFCLSWDDNVGYAEMLGIKLVPVLCEGLWNEKEIRNITFDTNKMEGYVFRLRDGFHYDNFDVFVAKYVRKNHVQTDDHWMQQEIVMNKLKS